MSGYQVNIFSYFSAKTYFVGTLLKCLDEVLLMICFHEEIRKIHVSILLD